MRGGLYCDLDWNVINPGFSSLGSPLGRFTFSFELVCETFAMDHTAGWVDEDRRSQSCLRKFDYREVLSVACEVESALGDWIWKILVVSRWKLRLIKNNHGLVW